MNSNWFSPATTKFFKLLLDTDEPLCYYLELNETPKKKNWDIQVLKNWAKIHLKNQGLAIWHTFVSMVKPYLIYLYLRYFMCTGTLFEFQWNSLYFNLSYFKPIFHSTKQLYWLGSTWSVTVINWYVWCVCLCLWQNLYVQLMN